MQAALDLVKVNQATHTAIRNGRWDNPNTWKDGKIPTQNARVHIPDGLTVTYGALNQIRHDTVRVDGTLKFAANQSSKLLLDTLVVTMSGELQVGTTANPIAANQTVDIVFSSNTAIAQQGDPQKLRRGLLSMGKSTIVGTEKLDHIKLKRNALAGDRELVLDLPQGMTEPQGWQKGDRLVLGGTQYSYNGSDADNSRFQDEVLEITGINGNRVTFRNLDIAAGPRNILRFDHKLPEVAEKGQLNLYVANTSRNVTFSSENQEQTPIARRGHTMFMNNPDVEIRNAGFVGLGRSDKTKLVDDPNRNVDGSIGNGTNPRGRYSVHLHQMTNNTYNGEPAIVSGNAVVDNPGWGIVTHSSKANISDNVIFDVAGAGLVAEGGNEQGGWWNNIVIKTTGVDWREALRTREDRDRLFDHGFRGDAYWIQGAGQVEFKDNIAISSHETGLTIFGDSLDPDDDFRDVETIAIKDLPPAIRNRVARAGQARVDVTDVPLKKINGIESYNANIGFKLWGHMTNFDGETEFSSPKPTTAHNLRSKISNLKLWGNRWRGMQVQYSTQVDFNNGLVIGDPKDPERIGVDNNHAAFNNRFNNYTIQGFEEGFTVPLNGPDSRERDYLKSTLSNSKFRDNTYHLGKTRRESKSSLGDDFPSDLILANNQFSTQAGNQAPTPKFLTRSLGGLTVELDASQSLDADPVPTDAEGGGPTLSRGIAAYGWDFNNDGRIDATGRKTTHTFSTLGNQPVRLWIWDSQGKQATLQKTLRVTSAAYNNPWVDPRFNQTAPYLEGWQGNNRWAGEGWFGTSGVTRDRAGAATLSNLDYWGSGVGQVIQNNRVHQGKQTLQFDLKSIEGAQSDEYWRNNTITVNLWGINGQFNNSGWVTDGPERVGTLPMQAQSIFSKTIGGRNKISDRNAFDWKTFRQTVDLGKGYQFLLIQFNTEATSDPGDQVSLDNVSLTGKPPTPGSQPSKSLIGTAGDDRLVGTYQNDTISGRRGNDILVGGAGSDFLRGDGGDDRIRGSMPRAGETDIDTMVGGAGEDQFFIGTRSHQYYLNDQQPGAASYAWIEDFKVSQDQLVLKGGMGDYRFRSMTRKGEQGVAVFHQAGPVQDLVVFLKGVSNLSGLQDNSLSMLS